VVITEECLSEQQLRAYLLGRSSGPESEQLEAHLQQCTHCEETVANLKADDTLAGHLRAIRGIRYCVRLQNNWPHSTSNRQLNRCFERRQTNSGQSYGRRESPGKMSSCCRFTGLAPALSSRTIQN